MANYEEKCFNYQSLAYLIAFQNVDAVDIKTAARFLNFNETY